MDKKTKIGLLGGAAYIVLSLPIYAMYFVPQELTCLFSCWSCLLPLSIYPAVGAFTAAAVQPPRESQMVAKESAVAGLIASGLFGIMSFINSIILSSLGITQRYIQQLPFESRQLLNETGLDSLYTLGGQIAIMLCVIPITIGFGVLLSTIGGVVYAAIRKDK